MQVIDHLLGQGEYISTEVKKDTIYIHHTAGGHRPDWTIDGWAHDKTASGGQLAVATAYVIGGQSITDKNQDFDGKVYRAFNDKYWAYHLGINAANNVTLNSKSIAIEICNYGMLTKTKEGIFLNYVNKPVPVDMVGTFAVPFRGYQYYHKYTPAQLISLKDLLKDIATRHGIDLKGGMTQFIATGALAFELNQAALKGVPGLWTHGNVRTDKVDCMPQPELIELIRSL